MFDPIKVIDAGQVTRWHSFPHLNRRCQTLADHQWGVVTILYSLLGRGNLSHNIIMYAMFHDVGERIVGDLPSPLKESDSNFASLHEEKENEAISLILDSSLPELTPLEAKYIEFADKLEALITIANYYPEPHTIPTINEIVDRVGYLGGEADRISYEECLSAKEYMVRDWVDLRINDFLESKRIPTIVCYSNSVIPGDDEIPF